MKKRLRIGEAAKLVGVTPKTVRHYHKVGLLAEAARSEGRYRLYSAEDPCGCTGSAACASSGSRSNV